MSKRRKFQSGFTLIDFLMYMAIVGIVLTAAGAVGLNVLFGKAKLGAVEEIGNASRFVLQKITERVRFAEGIATPVLGGSAGTLVLTINDVALNPTVFTLDQGDILFSEGGGAFTSILPGTVVATDLTFSNVSAPGTPGTVRIELSLQTKNPQNRQEYHFEETFYATANVQI